MPSDAPGSTALIVLTPEAEPVVGELYGAHSQAGRDEMSPHITLLVPFVPAHQLDESVHELLVEVFRHAPRFEYALRRFARFESGVLYLVPEPGAPFVALVEALTAAFPGYPPYEGIHDEVIPHLTVADTDDEDLIARITADLAPQLPLECRAAEATLVVRDDDLKWRPQTRLPFAGVE